MKILKLKSILFSLMAVVMVTVFLTSCEEDKLPLPTDDIQKSEISATVQNDVNDGRKVTFYLPEELQDADNETIKLYLENLTDEQVEEMEESYKIENYLGSIGSLEKVYNDLGDFALLTQSDLSKYTSEQQLADFESFDVNSEIVSRGCSTYLKGCYPVTLDGSKWRNYRLRFCCSWLKCKKSNQYWYASKCEV